ncbi:hypothetical protein Zm00014a_021970 [Zea mays]|uniref:TTF-type domain-containing protein n=1 Tax=Zea mays TaxID=4577 RepID=A0A3L6FEZ5_MAIZE|nr:hypothetical protein Zm00014a_021970 [Zea mays]
MKKQGDISSLFRNHAAKKQKFIASTPQEQEEEMINEEIVNPMPSAPPPPTLYDVSHLPHDPGERQPIASYLANDHDAIRRAYILRGPFQPYAHEFPNRKIGDRDHHFNFVWFQNFPWIEYSVKKDAAFCFMCYLFKSKANKGKGTSAFTSDGWNNLNKGFEALLKHVGSMSHKTTEEIYLGFINPNATIDNKIDNYIDGIRKDDRFKDITNLVDLSVKLVETKRHKVFDMVYLLLKLVLLLSMATTSVKRAFSAMSLVKTKLRNKVCDCLLDDCLITYINRDIFFEVNEEDIIETFMALRKRRLVILLQSLCLMYAIFILIC